MVDAGFRASDVPVPADLHRQLASGTRLLWLAIDEKEQIVAAMMTQLFPMRTGLACKMMECGGERLHEWKHLRSQIENYAKIEGCDRVILEGRPGWARVLRDYSVLSVALEKRI
jgi:hypothetical protein